LVLATALVLLGCSDDATGFPDGMKYDLGPNIDRGPIPDGVEVLPDGLKYSPEGPKIEIQAPEEGKVVLGTVMTVKAKITDSDGVNPDKVEVFIDNKPYKMTSTAYEIYEAKVDVSSLEFFLLYITAEDMVGNGNTSKWLQLVRDGGPKITVLAPGEGSYHKGSLPVQVIVTDKGSIAGFEARIGSVKLTQLTDQEKKKQKQTWVGTVKFDDAMFGTGLKGTQVIAFTASNANQATTIVTRTFIIDDQGPDIAIKSHNPGDLVGGVIKLVADVTDQAGVIAATVKVVIGNNLDQRTVVLTAAKGGNEYSGQFDTRTLSQYDLWPVMSFRASDVLGNEAHQDIQVGLDNGQPILELDPPADFYIIEKKDQAYLCSHPFDPVGPLAANDGQLVPQIRSIRARIEDQGNHVPSATWVPIAAINPATVWLYVLDDTTKALVADTTGDGYCDAINPNVVPQGTSPQPGEAVAVNLIEISPTGKADFTPDTSPLPSFCSSWGDEEDPPEPICKGVVATVAQHYEVSLAAIYTIPPVVSACYKCLGLPFDFLANSFNDGWVCAAATANDALGNEGVSPPIRLYVDKKAYGAGTGPGGAPDCTGTLDKATGKVDAAKPCKFRDPRDPSYSANSGCTYNKCDNCSSYACPFGTELEFPQTFCHCAGLLL